MYHILNEPQGTRINFLKSLYIFLVCIYAFISLKPFYIWKNERLFIFGAAALFLVAILMYLLKNKRKIDNNMIWFYVTTLLLVIPYALTNDILSYKGTFLVFFLPILCFIKKTDWIKLYRCFSVILAISYIPGILAFFIVLLGINLNMSTIVHPNGRMYFELLGSIFWITDYGFLLRLHGMFYEPGVVGTFSALILIADNVNLRKHINKIHLIAGLCSISTTFLILILFYFGIKKRKSFLILSVFLATLIYIVPQNTDLGVALKYNFIEKMPFSEHDNRTTESFDYKYYQFMDKMTIKEMFFGIGRSSYEENFSGDLSYTWKQEVIMHGWIYFIFLIIYMFLHAFRTKNSDAKLFALVFVLSLYQRPDIINISYFLVFFGGLYSISHKKEGQIIY
ncbi:hypothetical protein [Paenibacillus sp. MBLB4367]|uniref:hypothetical protein n=1 Tax=Paenibacillus sp. MBLB4367 TaxID=3384767 RepID=UPI0039083920